MLQVVKLSSLLNALPDEKILHFCKLEAFADDKSDLTQCMEFF